MKFNQKLEQDLLQNKASQDRIEAIGMLKTDNGQPYGQVTIDGKTTPISRSAFNRLTWILESEDGVMLEGLGWEYISGEMYEVKRNQDTLTQAEKDEIFQGVLETQVERMTSNLHGQRRNPLTGHFIGGDRGQR